MTNRTGGGPNSKPVSHVKAGKAEPRSNPVSVGAVSRLGGMMGEGSDHKPLYYNRVTASTPVGPSDNTKAGPGANRMVMRAGSQSATPKVSAPGKSKLHW